MQYVIALSLISLTVRSNATRRCACLPLTSCWCNFLILSNLFKILLLFLQKVDFVFKCSNSWKLSRVAVLLLQSNVHYVRNIYIANFQRILALPTHICTRFVANCRESNLFACRQIHQCAKIGGGDGGSSQCWQCQDLESVYLCNCSLSLCRPKWMNFQKISKRPQVRTLIITFTNLIIWTKEAWTEVLSLWSWEETTT